MLRQIGEARIEKGVRGRTDERERVTQGHLRRALLRFARRNELRHGGQTQSSESFRVEFALARRRREISFRKRRESLRQIESHPAALTKSFERDSMKRRMVCLEGLPRNLFVRVFETLFLKAKPRSQKAKDLRITFRFMKRRNRLLVDDQIEMAVSLVQIKMLKLRGRGQNDVGVITRVRHKLLVHDREQIFALETFDDFGLIGRNRRRVRVVNVESAHCGGCRS